MNNWIEIDKILPKDGIEVETKIDDGDDEYGIRNIQHLVYKKNLWWFPDMSMYVYYRPTHWRPVV